MEKQFEIEGMSCGHCVMAVEKKLNDLNLIKKHVKIGSVKVEYDPAIVSEQTIKNKIEEAGYLVLETNG